MVVGWINDILLTGNDEKMEKQRKINDTKRFLDNSINKKENCLKIEGGNSLEHEHIKFLICYILRNEGVSFISEAKFILGDRCDVLDLENRVIYEVVNKENLNNFKDKLKRYPNFNIKLIYCKDYEGLDPHTIIKKLKEVMGV